jgi:Domain of unknown function (DUF4157)
VKLAAGRTSVSEKRAWPAPAAAAKTAPAPAAIGARRAPGSTLPDSVQAELAPRLGHDFSRVRVHADGEAASQAAALFARAFTIGDDVFFGAGEYRPQTREGRHLLAHELTHVVQQRAARIDARTIERPGSRAEREADTAASHVASGRNVQPIFAIPSGITRDVGWARRGPIPDAYGMGYNAIFTSAGAASEPAVHDLRSFENAHMDVDVSKFEALPLARRQAVLALEPHAAGTACEPWFAKLRRAPGHRADLLATTMGGQTGQLYWGGNSGANPADKYRIRTTTVRPTDAAAPDVAAKVAGGSPSIATETNTNDFAVWMRGGATPTATSRMNCWEAIMFAAFTAGLITTAALRKIHKDAASAGEAAGSTTAYDAVIANALGLGSSKPLAALHPGRGDIVFFNKTSHVALSLGSRTAAGEHEVVSLWVLPPNPATQEFVSSIQRTTIEELARNMVTYMGSSPSIRFAPNPF